MFESSKLPELISAYSDYLEITDLGNIYSAILTDICFGIPTHNTLQKKEGKSFGYLFSTQSEILRGKLDVSMLQSRHMYLVCIQKTLFIMGSKRVSSNI